MKAHLTKKIVLSLMVTTLFLVAAWSMAAQQPYVFTYDGKQYVIGGSQPYDLDIQGYRVIPSSNYKAYRMGARDTPYTYTSVDVAPQTTQIAEQVPVEETVYVQKSEPQVVAKVQSEPVVLQAGETYQYDSEAYQPTFSDVQVQTRKVLDESQLVENVNLPPVQVQGEDTQDYQDEQYEDTHERDYQQEINHYHEVNRHYTHNYLHNLKQTHNHHYNVIDHHQDVHYTTEKIEQNYFEPSYDTVYNEPIIHEAERDESAQYEVVGVRTYEVPVTRIRYQPVVSTIVTPGMPMVTPIAYQPPYPAGYYPGGYPSGWYGNWRYASNWN